jgi:hypothetical protein
MAHSAQNTWSRKGVKWWLCKHGPLVDRTTDAIKNNLLIPISFAGDHAAILLIVLDLHID